MKHLLFCFLVALAVMQGTAVQAQHAGDIIVGRTAAGQLAIEANLDEAIVLPESSGLLNGWADIEPGFDHAEVDEPDEDFFQLEAGATIRLELVEVPAAFRVLDSSFNVADAAGESLLLGGHTVHTHVTWHINSAHPLFDNGQYLWSVAARVVDTGATGYAPSAPFVLNFVNVECHSGDLDGSEAADLDDLDDFVAVLLDASLATTEQRCAADLNFDGEINGQDVQGFIARLLE